MEGLRLECNADSQSNLSGEFEDEETVDGYLVHTPDVVLSEFGKPTITFEVEKDMSFNENNAPQTDEQRNLSALAMFEENLNGAPQSVISLLNSLRSIYDFEGDTKIHYVFVKNGQMRIKVYGEGLRSNGQNFATLSYRPSSKRLELHIKNDSPGGITLETKAGSGPLNLGLLVDSATSSAQLEEVLQLIARSKRLIRGS